ncbi:MAG: site-specific integrase [Candidatus Neomarinimicrobiota bacterium]
MSNWIITPDKYLTEEETKQLRKACREASILAKTRGVQAPVRDALIINLALGTGLRVSEIANLKIEDLHLKKGQNSLLVKNGKGNKDRLVTFSVKLKKQIQAYLAYRRSNSPYLFPSEREEQITRSAVQKVFKKFAKKAGIAPHYSIHSLRHTYATNLYKASSYNLRLVQKQLGHANISTTTVYSDVISKDLEEALENLELDEE